MTNLTSLYVIKLFYSSGATLVDRVIQPLNNRGQGFRENTFYMLIIRLYARGIKRDVSNQ